MHDLVRTIFSKLHTLDPETEEAKLIITEEESQEGEIKLNVTTSQNIAGQDDQSDDPHLTAKPQEDDESTLATESKPEVTVATTYKPECEQKFPQDFLSRLTFLRSRIARDYRVASGSDKYFGSNGSGSHRLNSFDRSSRSQYRFRGIGITNE